MKRDGWRFVGMRGSHRYFRDPVKPGKVTIAGHPREDLHPKTWESILRQAGLSERQQ